MKRQTARLLRGVIRLIEDDVRAVADSVVEIDEREASNAAHVGRRVGELERRVDYLMNADVDPPRHSVKAS